MVSKKASFVRFFYSLCFFSFFLLSMVALTSRDAAAFDLIRGGFELSGRIEGLPGGCVTMFPPKPMAAKIVVPLNRGVTPFSYDIRFVSDSRILLADTRLCNGQHVNVHLVPENGLVVVLIRETPNMEINGKMSATVQREWPTQGDPDPRTAAPGGPCIRGEEMEASLQMGPLAQNQTVTFTICNNTTLSGGGRLEEGDEVFVELALVAGKLFAVHIHNKNLHLPTFP
jgi:hypothetical protein